MSQRHKAAASLSIRVTFESVVLPDESFRRKPKKSDDIKCFCRRSSRIASCSSGVQVLKRRFLNNADGFLDSILTCGILYEVFEKNSSCFSNVRSLEINSFGFSGGSVDVGSSCKVSNAASRSIDNNRFCRHSSRVCSCCSAFPVLRSTRRCFPHSRARIFTSLFLASVSASKRSSSGIDCLLKATDVRTCAISKSVAFASSMPAASENALIPSNNKARSVKCASFPAL